MNRYIYSRIVILCIMSVLLISCSKKEEVKPPEVPKKVKMLTLTDLGGEGKREFPGTVKAAQTAEMAFRVSGPLIELPVNAGQTVKNGDLLARIDPRDFETAVKQTESNLEEAHAQLKAMKSGARPEEIKQLESSVEARKSEFTAAEISYNRMKQLHDERVISPQEFDVAKSKYEVAKANLTTAEQKLEEGRKGAREEDVEAQQARVKGLEASLNDATSALADTELRAPFDGIVARKYVNNFETVQAKQNILSIQDISRIEVDVDLSEKDYGRGASRTLEERVKQTKSLDLVVRFVTIPNREFPIQLKSFETEADPLTQTYRVTFAMDQPTDVSIAPGMNAIIYIRGTLKADGKPSFLIPVESVFAAPNGAKQVWVVNPDTKTVTARSVTTDTLIDGKIRITDGLQSGEQIVTSAANSLQEGMLVEPLPDSGVM